MFTQCIIVGFEVILQQYFNGGVFQPNTLVSNISEEQNFLIRLLYKSRHCFGNLLPLEMAPLSLTTCRTGKLTHFTSQGLSARAEPDALVRSDTLPQFAPVENCTTLCQVKYTAPESTWTFVANTTHASGFTHDVFFAFQGNVSAIRAVRTSDNPKTTSKRQNVNLDDVVVDSDVFLDYYFADEDFDVFLDYNFGSANTQIPIADTVSTFVVQNNIALMCLDFGSNFPNGFADSGVLQINNNDANALLTVGSAVELLTDCNALS